MFRNAHTRVHRETAVFVGQHLLGLQRPIDHTHMKMHMLVHASVQARDARCCDGCVRPVGSKEFDQCVDILCAAQAVGARN